MRVVQRDGFALVGVSCAREVAARERRVVSVFFDAAFAADEPQIADMHRAVLRQSHQRAKVQVGAEDARRAVE